MIRSARSLNSDAGILAYICQIVCISDNRFALQTQASSWRRGPQESNNKASAGKRRRVVRNENHFGEASSSFIHRARGLRPHRGSPTDERRRSLSTQRKISALAVPNYPRHQCDRDYARMQRKQVSERSEQQEEEDLSLHRGGDLLGIVPEFLSHRLSLARWRNRHDVHCDRQRDTPPVGGSRSAHP